MPVFTYKAKDTEGRTIKDKISAQDSQAALAQLRATYPLILSLDEEKSGAGRFGSKKKVKLEQLAQFSRELATMVGSGTPLVKSLIILSKQFKERTVASIARQLSTFIEGGGSFAEGLSRFPAVFSPLYVNLVAAGEASGMLNKVLDRLAVYLEKTSVLIRKIKNAMIYPVAVICVAVIIMAILMIKVIPSFKNIFEGLGGELPLPTQVVIKISELTKRFFFYIIVAGFLGGILFTRYINTGRGRLWFDRLKLSLPVFGTLFQKLAIANFSRTLATLLRGGLPILEALKIVSKSIGNRQLENSILQSMEAVRQGKRLSSELEKEKNFPPMVVEMISTGEETGQLDEMLDKIADSYEEQVDIAAAGLVSMIEPFIIVFLGVFVGGIVISMFLPILKMSQMVGR
jgi:type IV pilus assembly protein PilC